jgi:hypothetical protein
VRRYVDKKRVVEKERACVEIACDICGAKAEHPDEWYGNWEHPNCGEVVTTVMKASYSIDGEENGESADVCFECMKALLAAIRRHRIIRHADGSLQVNY